MEVSLDVGRMKPHRPEGCEACDSMINRKSKFRGQLLGQPLDMCCTGLQALSPTGPVGEVFPPPPPSPAKDQFDRLTKGDQEAPHHRKNNEGVRGKGMGVVG